MSQVNVGYEKVTNKGTLDMGNGLLLYVYYFIRLKSSHFLG